MLLALYSLVCLMVHRWGGTGPRERFVPKTPSQPFRMSGPGAVDDLGRGEMGSLKPGLGDHPNVPPGGGTRAGTTGGASLKWPKSREYDKI